MEEVKSISVISKSALQDHLQRESGLVLVACEGRPIMVLSSGRLVHVLDEVPTVLKDVSIYRIDKWELLDALNGELKLPEKVEKSRSPRVVEFSMSLDLPPELSLKVENAILDFIKRLAHSNLAVSSISASGRVRQGFTGTNILLLRVSMGGYTTGDVPVEALAREMASSVEREVGFEVRVYIKEASFERVSDLPIVRFTRSFVNFRGGRIIEIPLQRQGKVIPKVDRAKLEAEVERLLKEAGISRELVELTKEGGERVSVGSIEREVMSELSGIRGVSLNWVKLTKGASGYRVTIGVDRTSRDVTDSELMNVLREALKRAEGRIKALGRGVGFEGAYLVVERDIY
ncbi:hypothetical protein [Palaeococcus ferrophilus]|uniref:hypothetical protein n=1 Tax=Palaeococcus ferrophilus TaxID=83868 RepID=UPI00064F8BED|nr:hypothetical protein [Palaeococcus ferrophilus]